MTAKRIATFVVALLALTGTLSAQSIKGVISDSQSGEVIPNANIFIVELARGAAADMNGAYEIQNLSTGEYTIRISFIGYETIVEKINVANGDLIKNFTLTPDYQGLEEVVVTAYGNQKKKAVTGAATSVGKQAIEARPITNVASALQGVAPGVSVATNSGQPGGGVSIQIRGAGSINASTEPLYVIDGLPVLNINPGNSGSANTMSMIDPNDIEDITILKDASASALYGSRAANGVVLITTKKGRKGAVRVDFRAASGFSDIAVEQHKTLNATEYFGLFWQDVYNGELAAGASPADAATNANAGAIAALQANPYNTAQPFGPGGVLNSGAALLYDTDWRDLVVNRGQTQDYGLSVSGGSDRTTYYLAASIFDQEGILPASTFQRGSTRINVETRITDFLTMALSSNNSFSEQYSSPGGGGANNPLRFANLTSNVYSFFARDADGNIINDSQGNPLYNYNTPTVLDFHPVGLAEVDEFIQQQVRSVNNLSTRFKPTEDITLRSDIGFDVNNVQDRVYENRNHGNATPQGGRATRSYNRYTVFQISNTANYNKTFGEQTIDLIAGQEYYSERRDFLSAQRTGFGNNILRELDAATVPTQASSSFAEKRIISYLSRLNYGFRDKYFLTASIRRDGSSVFGDGNKWGTFGSVGASWIISDESFMDPFNFVDNLKLRASWGTTGNDNIGFYSSLGLLGFSSAFDYNGLPGSTYTQQANPELGWEINENIDLGIEFELFKNKLSGEFVYYTRDNIDLLFDRPIPVSTAGFGSIISNLASVRNSGIEVAMNYTVFNTKDLVWSINANLSTLNNEILSLPDGEEVQSGTKRFAEGSDIYAFYMQEFAGIDPETGSALWYRDILDAEGEPTGERETVDNYAQADRYFLGSSLPDFFGGFGTNVNYKGFDLQALFSYTVGNTIYDFTYADITHMGGQPGQQLHRDVLENVWTPGSTTATLPAFGINQNAQFIENSSRFLFDGDFLRLKNLTIGYTLPAAALKVIKAQRLRVYVTGENLLTFQAHKGLDPELPRSGLSNNIFPQQRTITAGINLSF